MRPGDWVALPSKLKRAIHFGEIVGDYTFDETQEPVLRHFRSVKWFATDIPRTSFEQDILYSFGPQTICRIDAEDRIRAMARNGWRPVCGKPPRPNKGKLEDAEDSTGTIIDLEASARDEIATLIGRKYKGHGMAWLVKKVLDAQGFSSGSRSRLPDIRCRIAGKTYYSPGKVANREGTRAWAAMPR
jgi:restriction system protein